VTTTARSARASVEVPVGPATAFHVFTEQIDQWWVPGPINYFDAERAVAMRVEPGPGGRVLEEYADGPPLVIAEIIDWAPGERLVYRGVVDDSQTEITFTSVGTATRVDVNQYLRPGGTVGFLFWPNVIVWFAAETSSSAQHDRDDVFATENRPERAP
jgi:uncharacterized protein YndB with AHSA1/START domain